MPRSSGQTRRRILDGAYRLFRRQGYSRVSMDEVAAAARVTKRTLYYHFESKDQLLAKVLEDQHHLALAAFKTFGDRLSGSPQAIVDGLFRELAVWSDKPRWSGSGFTRLVIELADLPGHPARLIARRHKAMLEAHWPSCWPSRVFSTRWRSPAKSGCCRKGQSRSSWCMVTVATQRRLPPPMR
jgi:AcrR family transcriptional regulator